MTEALVLVPGMMCDARVYGEQLTTLSRERPVMVAPVGGGERIEEIASGLLDRLPLRFALAGHGLGGMVAMEVLRRAPDRVNRLCLIATSPLAETPAEAAAREPLIVGARAGRLSEVLGEVVPPAALAQGPGRRTVQTLLERMGLDLGGEVFVRQSRALQRRRDQQGTLRKCAVPTMILCGAEDGLIPVKRQQFLSDLIPGAALRVIEDAGYVPMLEQPDAVIAALRDWLRAPLVLN